MPDHGHHHVDPAPVPAADQLLTVFLSRDQVRDVATAVRLLRRIHPAPPGTGRALETLRSILDTASRRGLPT